MAANKDELVPPDWLTVEFVQMVLRTYKKQDLTVLDIVIKPGSNAGDHFASVMFRIEATITFGASDDQHVMSLILKTMPFVKGGKMDFFKDVPLFEVETKMYAKTLPAMEPLLATCGVTPFWPKLVYQSFEPAPVIIFEDLGKLGYTVPKDPFSFEPAKEIYARLAVIHATTFYLHHVNGYDLSEFNKGIFDFPPESTENMFGKHLDCFINELATWAGYDVHLDKLRNFRRKYLEFSKKTLQSIPGGYNVLNHGDFHQRNVLIRATESGVFDYILLDYQICFWTSPALDLVYSLVMMVTTEARKRRNELIKHYHEEFCRILEQLKFDKPVPTLEDLNKEIERFGFLEVILYVCFLPFSFVDLTKLDDFFDENEKNRAFARSLYKNEDYQKLIRDEMPRFLEMGFLDLENVNE